MKKSEKKVVPFPTPQRELATSTIICQIGNERFAIHFEVEDLPPAAPLQRLKPPTRKGKRIRSLHAGPRSGSSKDSHP